MTTDRRPARPVTRGMRVLLYALTALTFIAGTQLFVLADHTDAFFSWTVAPPITAAFVGAGFWSASAVVFWAARQRHWARARVIVPTIAVVATMLLLATLEHTDAFHGLFGIAWIEIYAVFPPVLAALAAMQLALPGVDRHSGEHLPRALRCGLAAEALVAIAAGAVMFASSSVASDLWPWALSDLTAKAIGTWLIGTGTAAGIVALVDDRAVMPGNALAQLVFGGGVLFAVTAFAPEVDFASPGAYALIAYAIATVAIGAAAAWLSLREGRYAPDDEPRGGIPVELRAGSVQPWFLNTSEPVVASNGPSVKRPPVR
jgi:hypothetical protein